MLSAFTLYILLIVTLFFSHINTLFFYLAFFILVLPLIFKSFAEIGLSSEKFKTGLIYGFLPSSLYVPFIWNSISINSLYQSGQVFAEEIFFRGYLFSAIPIKNIHIKNIVISLMFTLPHVIINPHLFSLLTFFPSLIFGYLYIGSGSIIAPFVFHLFSNLFFQLYLIHKL